MRETYTYLEAYRAIYIIYSLFISLGILGELLCHRHFLQVAQLSKMPKLPM